MKFLITGARAPAALQLARILVRSGHQAYTADSLSHCLAARSSLCAGHFALPAPARDYAHFAERAAMLLDRLRPDAVICTCEEIFYWARAASDKPESFASYAKANPDFRTLRLLHDKGSFWRVAQSCSQGLGAAALKSWRFGPLPDDGPWVCKPAFSRFAVHTRIGLARREAEGLLAQGGWVAQRMAVGREFCTWAYFVDGQEVLSSAYEPVYRAGKGSGIGLRSVQPGDAAEFAKRLASKLRYTGQLAFDWIDDGSNLSCLECNPRSTSGIHFFDPVSSEAGSSLARALSGSPFSTSKAPDADISVKWALAMFGAIEMARPLAGAPMRAFFLESRDAEAATDDPGPGKIGAMGMAFAEIALRALRTRSGLLSASTADIEWNGQNFWSNP